jgi:hypothetical protein
MQHKYSYSNNNMLSVPNSRNTQSRQMQMS